MDPSSNSEHSRRVYSVSANHLLRTWIIHNSYNIKLSRIWSNSSPAYSITVDPRTKKQYAILSASKQNYDINEAQCAAIGMFLPEPRDEQENDFLDSLNPYMFVLGMKLQTGQWRFVVNHKINYCFSCNGLKVNIIHIWMGWLCTFKITCFDIITIQFRLSSFRQFFNSLTLCRHMSKQLGGSDISVFFYMCYYCDQSIQWVFLQHK